MTRNSIQKLGPEGPSPILSPPCVSGLADEIEKIAIDPVTVGTAALLHGGLNVGLKAAKGTRWGRAREAAAVAKGLLHGETGRKLRPGLHLATRLAAGPEVTVPYDVGRALGAQRLPRRKLKKLRKNLAILFGHEIHDAPIAGPLVGGISQHVTAPRVPQAAAPSIWQRLTTTHADDPGTAGRAVAGVLAAGAAVANPEAAMHLGFTGMRNVVRNSRAGRRFLENQAAVGAFEATRGRRVSPAVEAAADYLISPAALDTRRLANAATRRVIQNPGRREIASLAGQFAEAPGLEEHFRAAGLSLPENLRNRLPQLPEVLQAGNTGSMVGMVAGAPGASAAQQAFAGAQRALPITNRLGRAAAPR